MKKLFLSFALAAALSSCGKDGLKPVSDDESKDIVFNISVSTPGADVKGLVDAGWEKDDKISIWFDTNRDSTANLVIKYDGSEWTQVGKVTLPSSGSGYVKSLYDGIVKVASKDNYTFSDNALTLDITNWVFLTEIQVVVSGDGIDGSKPSQYILSCDKFAPCTGYTVGDSDITATTGKKGTAVSGISDGSADSKSGLVFFFATADYSASSTDRKDFTFVLKDKTGGSEVTKVYNPNIAIEATERKHTIKILTIASTKFSIHTIPEFVDLGLSSGLKWRSWNLGANKPEEYGKYFSWGDIAGRWPSNDGTFANYESFEWRNDVFGETYERVAQSTACPNGVLAKDYDAAYRTNNAWRMPTKEDFVELAKQCFVEWTENYNGTGVGGLIFWKAKTGDAGWFKNKAGKGHQIKADGSEYNRAVDHLFGNEYNIYTDPYVFFPPPGRSVRTFLAGDAGGIGYYWASTCYSSDTWFAHQLFFSDDLVLPQEKFARCYGSSVRPVTDVN